MSSKKKSSKAKSKRKLTSSQTPKHSKLSMAIQDPAESIESSTALDLSTIAHSQQELSSASQAFKITSTPEANDSKEQPEDQESQLLEGSELLVPEQANDSKEQLEAQKEPESKAPNTGGLKAKDESLDLQSSKEDIASHLSQDKPVTHDELVDVGSEDSSLSSIQDSELEVGSMTSLFAGSGLLMDFGSESVESKAATSLTKSACSKSSKCPANASQDLEHEAEQGSLLVDGYIVGQGGLFDALEEENEPKLPSHPSNFDEFSDVLAPSENLPEVLLSEAEESPYSILEPALDFFGGSSSESSYSEESDPYASLDGNSLYNPKLVSPASAGAGAPMYMDTPNMQDKEPSLKVPKVLKCEHLEYGQSGLDLAKDNLTESAQIDSALAKPEIGHIEAAVGQKSKQINDEGSIEDVETMADESKPKRKRASTKKVVFDPFIYPIDPKVNVVCGIDEAGRGPLMGDVVAACVILDHEHMIPGLNDSKKLTEKARDALVPVIKEQAIAWGIGRASPQEIDELNILNATFLAMRRAYDAMHKSCNLGLVDGNKIPKTFSDLPVVLEAVVKGDARVPEISAASILAKTARDADLYELDKLYPEYGFAHHKGYPTKDHLAVLQHLPILPCYRLSYGPIKKLLSNNPDYHEAISENVAHRMQEINQRQQAKLQAQKHEISLVSIDDFEH